MSVVKIKDPDAVLDYAVDFSDWLAEGDSVSAHDVAVASGNVVIDSTTEADGVVTAWLSGGSARTRASVRYRVTTAEGRIDDRTKHFYLTQR